MASNRTRLMLKSIAFTLAAIAIVSAVGGWLVLKSGWYHIGATNQHWQLVHTVLEQGMHDSVKYHARNVSAPPLGQAHLQRGAAVYRDNCLQCHGGPGVSQQDFAKAMQPVPGPLVDVTQRWKLRELYWITRHGIKMSGMPAWEYHLPEHDLWSVVAFMQTLPTLSTQSFGALMQAEAPAAFTPVRPVKTQGDPERGRIALTQYACNACHKIPGVTGSDVYVGRPLDDLAARKYIAGKLPNTQANLIGWIRNPQQVDPGTAMPMQGVTEEDALDISAYLLTRH